MQVWRRHACVSWRVHSVYGGAELGIAAGLVHVAAGVAPMHPVLELAEVDEVNKGVPACHGKDVLVVLPVELAVKAVEAVGHLLEDGWHAEIPQLLDDRRPLQVSGALHSQDRLSCVPWPSMLG